MCNVCGFNCGKGGGLSRHVLSAHGLQYDDYKKAFYSQDTLITDHWDDSVSTKSGKTVILHVLVRRFVGDAGKRGVRGTGRPHSV